MPEVDDLEKSRTDISVMTASAGLVKAGRRLPHTAGFISWGVRTTERPPLTVEAVP